MHCFVCCVFAFYFFVLACVLTDYLFSGCCLGLLYFLFCLLVSLVAMLGLFLSSDIVFSFYFFNMACLTAMVLYM